MAAAVAAVAFGGCGAWGGTNDSLGEPLPPGVVPYAGHAESPHGGFGSLRAPSSVVGLAAGAGPDGLVPRTVSAPSVLKPGERFRLIIAITNTGEESVRFDPCPVMTIRVGAHEQDDRRDSAAMSRELNCNVVRSIDPGATLQHEWRFHAPVSANRGPGGALPTIWWSVRFNDRQGPVAVSDARPVRIAYNHLLLRSAATALIAVGAVVLGIKLAVGARSRHRRRTNPAPGRPM